MYYPVGAADAPYLAEEGGETMFLNHKEDRLVGGVLPRANRVVGFDTSLLHYGKGPTARHPGGALGQMRLILVIKCVSTPPQHRTCGDDAEAHCGFRPPGHLLASSRAPPLYGRRIAASGRRSASAGPTPVL